MPDLIRRAGSVAFLLVIFVLVLGLAWPQQAPPLSEPSADSSPIDVDRGAAGLTRWLHALRTRASILMITAHPDDEDGGVLAYETRGAGARAALLTLNRGEGGQNAMSSDLYDALGLVRTEELLAAGRYYGADQYWTRAIDYGFSKTREEALEKWDHDRVLSDVVRVIRMTRPLVIIGTFIGAATDGHGNHQVAGQMAQEAFLAAGDPSKFPEQLREGLRPWTPLKVYARVPFFDVTPKGMYDYAIDKYVPVRFFDYIRQNWSTEKPSTTIEIPEGDLAPASGLTYLQIGREGLGFQKSQNNGVAIPPPAPQASAYHRYGARVPAAEHEESFFDGIDASVQGIASLAAGAPEWLQSGLAELARFADQANAQYQPDRPQAIAPLLADGLRATRALMDRVRASSLPANATADVQFELRAKQDQFEHALAGALGVSMLAVVAPEKEPQRPGPFPQNGPTFSIAIPGQAFGVRVDLLNQSPENLSVQEISLAASDGKNWQIAKRGEQPNNLASRALAVARFSVTAPADAALTRPYFTRPDEEQPYYDLADTRYRNLSLAPYPLSASVTIAYRGVPLHLSQVVQAMQRIQAQGVIAQPLIVGPAISVAVSPAAGAVPLGAKSFEFSCTVHTNVKGPAKGTLRLKLPSGWRSTPESAAFSMQRDGEDQTITFSVLPNLIQPGEHRITAVAEYQGRTYEEGYRLAGYPGLRPYPYFRRAVYRAVGVDVKIADGLRVGYLPGTGDDVPQALENLGRGVRTLAASDITQGNLSGYDAIILGTRAYAVRPELKAANNRLLEYVRNGGVLVVQYNLQDFDQNYGPYPFSLGNNPQKVVDEASKVKLLKADSPAFTWPNRIAESDFAGWVEERGHGFMQTWDPRYEALVETNDPDQDPQRGGLLLARYGKGAYIYDAFALYRQLPSGVPGAYRILANLVSLGKNPAFLAQSPGARPAGARDTATSHRAGGSRDASGAHNGSGTR
ncbi:MAG TPA: PIG-L family deacetylase [Bryobacteraceae bacterium]|nr:PIG-L family deacetylase [Bryobacteraceae bacterium]